MFFNSFLTVNVDCIAFTLHIKYVQSINTETDIVSVLTNVRKTKINNKKYSHYIQVQSVQITPQLLYSCHELIFCFSNERGSRILLMCLSFLSCRVNQSSVFALSFAIYSGN